MESLACRDPLRAIWQWRRYTASSFALLMFAACFVVFAVVFFSGRDIRLSA
jgi:hypothetical protein